MEKYDIKGVSCANCALKLEKQVKERPEVNGFEMNFMSQKFKLDSENPQATIEFIENFEPDIKVIGKKEKSKHNHEHTHNHGHDHDHEHDDIKVATIKVIIGLVLFAISFISTGNVQIIIRLIAYIIVSYSVIIKAVKNILRGNFFDEFFLMSLATIAAISIGELVEAVAVMLFYSIGEIFQEKALQNSRKSIQDLLELKIESVRMVKANEFVELEPENIKIGTEIEVRVGEKIPIDGELISQEGLVNTAALTGESVPRVFEKGTKLLAGMIVENQPLRVKTTQLYENSAIAKMLEMVETASSRKTKTERFISEFAKIYTPIVILIAVLLIIILPMIGVPFEEAVYRTVILLVISCPCALVISVPLGYFAGVGQAAKYGVLIKGANYLDQLAKLDTVMLDKTGTITKGNFDVTTVDEYQVSDIINQAIYLGERKSNHPIARSITKKYNFPNLTDEVINYTEIKGSGIRFEYKESEYLIGNHQLLADNNVIINEVTSDATLVYVAQNNIHVQTIHITDEIKSESKAAIAEFKKLGIENIVMLTGDREITAQKVAKKVGITNYYAELLPEDKVNHVGKMLDKGNQVGFIGDGINDAPVIARANVGIAMGALGSDIAIETADVVINNDSLANLVKGIKISKYSRKIIKQNIAFALIVKFTVIALGIFGDATMWEAVFSDVGVSLIAILNSLRILRK